MRGFLVFFFLSGKGTETGTKTTLQYQSDNQAAFQQFSAWVDFVCFYLPSNEKEEQDDKVNM